MRAVAPLDASHQYPLRHCVAFDLELDSKADGSSSGFLGAPQDPGSMDLARTIDIVVSVMIRFQLSHSWHSTLGYCFSQL